LVIFRPSVIMKGETIQSESTCQIIQISVLHLMLRMLLVIYVIISDCQKVTHCVEYYNT
jgi:hypothetical protein